MNIFNYNHKQNIATLKRFGVELYNNHNKEYPIIAYVFKETHYYLVTGKRVKECLSAVDAYETAMTLNEGMEKR
jgi:hypothetical protein